MSTEMVECWKCDECGHCWIRGEVYPERCPSTACRKRSWDKGGSSSVVVPKPVVPAVKMNPAMERFMTKLVVAPREPISPTGEELVEPTMQKCKYREYDGESGETMACGLDEHSAKVKHGKWQKL